MNDYNKKNYKNQQNIIESNEIEGNLKKNDFNLENFTEKRLKTKVFTSYIDKYVSSRSLEMIKDCGVFLMFIADLKLEYQKLGSANFCKNRFCPMCSWRKSKKDALIISILMNYIRDKHNKEFIFLTLTAPNVKGDKLNENIKSYNGAFKKLMELKEVKLVTCGYIRKLEVTYNKNRDDYHPHFHCILAVNSSYFKNNGYISKKRWLELWQNCMNNKSITQVDVQKAKMDDYKQVYELAKYSAKDSDYLISNDIFKVFYKSLKGKRLIVYGGLFKEAMKKFKLGELDEYKEKDNIKYFWALVYKWQIKEYEEYIQRELTEEEKERFNGKFNTNLINMTGNIDK